MMKPGINKAKGQSDQTGLDDKAKDKHSNAQNNNIPTTMDSPNPAGSAQPPSRARAFDPAGTEVHLASSSGYLGADEGTGTGTSTSGSGGQGVAMPSRRSFYAGYDALGRVERKDRMAGALRDLDSEINKIETHDKMAYQWAVDRCPKEARSKRRREAFLEREGLNSKLAAQRIVRYWDERHVLFGPDRCFLPMTLHGALQDEVAGILRNPINHILGARDGHGKGVIYSDPDQREGSSSSRKNEAIALWYMLETQIIDRRQGLVFLSSSTVPATQATDRSTSSSSSSYSPCNININSSASFSTPSNFDNFSVSRYSFDDIFPLWISNIHACKLGTRPSVPNYDYAFSKTSQENIKIHTGTQLAILKSLDGEALPSKMLPTEMGGGVVLDNPHWINVRLSKEYAATARREKRRAARRAATDSSAATTSFSSAAAAADRRFSDEKPGVDDYRYDDDGCAKPPVQALDVDASALAQKTGRKADERMKLAAVAKLRNPLLSRRDALIIGGYEYPEDDTDLPTHQIFDAEGVSLYQRMNHLNRRVRQVREKVEDDQAMEEGRPPPIRTKRPYIRRHGRNK